MSIVTFSLLGGFTRAKRKIIFFFAAFAPLREIFRISGASPLPRCVPSG
jgi:hypothetical protein